MFNPCVTNRAERSPCHFEMDENPDSSEETQDTAEGHLDDITHRDIFLSTSYIQTYFLLEDC